MLTAAFVARPSLETFGALNRTLMRSEPKRGGCWGGCTKATFEADGRFEGLRLPTGPWHLRRPAAAGGRRRDDGSWRGMGAWYADQGLFYHTLALRLKAYVPLGYSYPTAAQGARCLPVLHLSAPPKCWECPGPRCVAARWAQKLGAAAAAATVHGGHACCSVWWRHMQLAVHGGGGPAFANGTCASSCRATLLSRYAERQRLLETTPETRRCAADDRRKAASGRVSGGGAARRARGRRRGAAAAVPSTDRVPEVSLD